MQPILRFMATIPKSRNRLIRKSCAAVIVLAFLATGLDAQLASDELVTDTFKLETDTLRQSLAHFTSPAKSPKVPREDSATILAENLRETFAAAGIRFDNDPLVRAARPTDKAMFLN